tara:strand:+ start:379 stop:903 length:525 start_codon:yes stop_codon:yes gene_type:complete
LVIAVVSVVTFGMTNFQSYREENITDLETDLRNYKDIEDKRVQQKEDLTYLIEFLEQNRYDEKQFLRVLDQSISDTNALLVEYESLDLPSEIFGFSVDTYKQLSMKSLNKQSEVLSKMKEYVIKKEYIRIDQPEGLELKLIKIEFARLFMESNEYHGDVIRALKTSMEAAKTQP